MFDFRDIYHASEERTRFAVAGLAALTLVGLAGIVFLSASLTLALIVAIAIVFMTFARPLWTLAFLAWYLPFEPFLLKWIPDNVYIFARYSSELLVYLLAAVVIWRLFSGTLRWRKSRADILFIAFCVAIILSSLVNFTAPFVAILGVRQIIRFILLYFITVQLAPTWKFARMLLVGLFVIIGIQVVLGSLEAAFGARVDNFLLPSQQRTVGEIQLTAGTVQFWDPGERVFGTMGRYDQLGTFLAFVLLILAAYLYEDGSDKHIRSLRWLFLLSLPILGLTYSRSAWFGFVLGFLFIALWAKRDKRVLLGVATFIAAAALYLGVTGLAVNKLIDVPEQPLAERFFEAFSVERWTGEYYGLGRTYWMVHTVISVVPASPLFGHGPGSYGGGAVAALGNTKVYDTLGLPFGVYGTEGYIDNNWFSLWGETGTLGFSLFVALYLTLFVQCIRVWRTHSNANTRALALGTAAAMIAVALNAFLATFLEARTLAPYVWIMAGLVTVLSREESEKHIPVIASEAKQSRLT